MDNIVVQGLLLGLSLAVSLGPIFIALTQTSIEKGIKPGLILGSGIWISDIIFILVFYNFIFSIKTYVENTEVEFYLGLVGAVVFISFGAFLILSNTQLNYSKVENSYRNYIGYWLKGFLINTLNPFTFFFWMGVISTYVIGKDIGKQDATILLGIILLVIILSDMAKVVLANYLKQKLNDSHIQKVTNFSGIILLLFGFYLVFQVW